MDSVAPLYCSKHFSEAAVPVPAAVDLQIRFELLDGGIAQEGEFGIPIRI